MHTVMRIPGMLRPLQARGYRSPYRTTKLAGLLAMTTAGFDIHKWLKRHETKIGPAIAAAAYAALDGYVAIFTAQFVAALDESGLLAEFPFGYEGALIFARRLVANTVTLNTPDDAAALPDTE